MEKFEVGFETFENKVLQNILNKEVSLASTFNVYILHVHP